MLRRCLEDGEVILSRHFRDELSNEDCAIEDAWTVLRKGQIFDAPEIDVRSREWKYRIEGHEPGGKWLAIVFSFKTVDRAFLVTVFSIESRRRAQ